MRWRASSTGDSASTSFTNTTIGRSRSQVGGSRKATKMSLWGGRFDKEPNAAIAAFTNSLPFDQRMAEQDVRGSIAHCRMLGHTGIVSPEEASQIEAGLREILAEVSDGRRLEGAEDIHSWVEARLREKNGAVAGKLHTARSRNDQVA